MKIERKKPNLLLYPENKNVGITIHDILKEAC